MNGTELTQGLCSILDKMEVLKNEMIKIITDYAEKNEPLDLYDLDGGETMRKLDGLGFLNGWAVDRLLHRTVRNGKSLLGKIRKAQGYNAV